MALPLAAANARSKNRATISAVGPARLNCPSIQDTSADRVGALVQVGGGGLGAGGLPVSTADQIVPN